MKVVAINGSPNMEKGNTSMVLTPFLQGMKDAGAEVELFFTQKLKINPCYSDCHCWFKKPGECFQKDDMVELLPKLRDASIRVFASPVYGGAVSGPIKNMLDRMIPMVQPVFIPQGDSYCHPLHENTTPGKLVLISSCGFWEPFHFDPLISQFKDVCRNASLTFGGAVVRPHAKAMAPMIENGANIDDIFEAAHKAGKQLVIDGEMKQETLESVRRPLLPMGEYIDNCNNAIKEKIAENLVQ